MAASIRTSGGRSGRGRRWLLAAAVALLVLLAVAMVYVTDYYRAGEESVRVEAGSGVMKIDGGWAVGDEGSESGLIFYPGGKVEARSYLPLLRRVADGGVFAVLCEMPLNLAVLDLNAADRMIERFPRVRRWAVGGHSLGGSMATQYAANNPGKVGGLVLLASYAPSALPEGVPALAVYGSEDGVMNRDRYALALELLPEYEEVVIPGGNHAKFGDYGPQSGDGEGAMPEEEQREAAARAILNFLSAQRAG